MRSVKRGFLCSQHVHKNICLHTDSWTKAILSSSNLCLQESWPRLVDRFPHSRNPHVSSMIHPTPSPFLHVFYIFSSQFSIKIKPLLIVSFSPSYRRPTSLQVHPQLCHLAPNPCGILLLRSRSYDRIRYRRMRSRRWTPRIILEGRLRERNAIVVGRNRESRKQREDGKLQGGDGVVWRHERGKKQKFGLSNCEDFGEECER